jgi:hypothetical protein
VPCWPQCGSMKDHNTAQEHNCPQQLRPLQQCCQSKDCGERDEVCCPPLRAGARDRPSAKIIRRTAKGARSWGREVARIPTATVAGPDSRMIAAAVVGSNAATRSTRKATKRKQYGCDKGDVGKGPSLYGILLRPLIQLPNTLRSSSVSCFHSTLLLAAMFEQRSWSLRLSLGREGCTYSIPCDQ